MHLFCRFLIISFFSLKLNTASAWGPEGHAIVGRLALRFVTPEVKKNVIAILGNMSIDTATNWMDIMKSNADYDYMRPWHYVDFPKGKTYTPSHSENIIQALLIAYSELSHKNTICEDQVKTDLYILLHLMGDLHMPLHTGYDEDLGGNKVIVQYDNMKTHNLHRFWDEDIIRLKKITEQDCLKHLEKYNGADKDVDFLKWMTDSRSLLGDVYDFPGFILSDEYLNKNAVTVEKQLLKAGLRLALILNKLFPSTAPTIEFSQITTKFKNGLPASDALKNIGKKVTICERVYNVRSTATITQINLGGKFPNNPLTIVIFAKSYKNFSDSFEDLYKDKNICVKGVLEEYKGKAQIILQSPDDIIVQQ